MSDDIVKEVKRYTFWHTPTISSIQEDKDGQYVYYGDYENLLNTIEELRLNYSNLEKADAATIIKNQQQTDTIKDLQFKLLEMEKGKYGRDHYVNEVMRLTAEERKQVNKINKLENFMMQVAKNTNCLPDFSKPNDNEHIFKVLNTRKEKITKLEAVVDTANTSEIRTALSIFKNGLYNGMIRTESGQRKKEYEAAINAFKEALSELRGE